MSDRHHIGHPTIGELIFWFTLATLFALSLAFAPRLRAQSPRLYLMPIEKDAALRASIPPIDDREMVAKIAEAMLYTEAEMPLAYQFQPISGGSGTSYTVFYSPYVRLNSIDPFTNGNREFPWRTPGGIDNAENVTDEFRFIWLPKKPDGNVWPVVIYRDALEKSDSVNMPIPQGWRWIYPVGTTIGEVLAMRFSDGYLYTYEIRTRTRELDDWDVEIYRPFPTREKLAEHLAKLDQQAALQLGQVQTVTGTLEDSNHPRRAFRARAGIFRLPRLSRDVSATLLTTSTFLASSGQTFYRDAVAPTADHDESIVPRQYQASFLGADRETCANCHRHTLRHVDRFENRDWYGYIRGSDGIFSFHPIDPTCIGPPDRAVKFRQAFSDAGIIAQYDPQQHPADTYQAIRSLENLPATSYPQSGRRTIRN